MSLRFRLLTEKDVRRVLSMEDLIEAMASALARFSSGEVVQPVRSVLQVGRDKAYFGVMPAFVGAPAALGAKLVTLFNRNTERGLPTHLASILLLDHTTGALVALMDGRFITEARTAAVSAVSTRVMARENASILAVIGSGVQARSHIEALPLVRRFREVRVWSPNRDHRERVVREMSGSARASLVAASDAEQAVKNADVIALVTSSRTPVIREGWIKNDAHVISVGACLPDQREIDPALTARGRLVVDSRAGALAESGDVVMGIAEGRFTASHISGELGEVVAGRVPGRLNDEMTIFKSLGMAVEDVVAADLAYRQARERDIGTLLEL
ncbi:MAG: ornithine cyclodeaminase family protein [Acidobacteria bacterium]|nr:ornithine cyclodeaminase family protein [Acidobacteriota bacterium]